MRFSTNMFIYDKKNRSFLQELSSLDIRPNQRLFHRIYQDACDEGITLISSRTGHEVDYYIDKIDTDEGDIWGWHLLPTPESIRKVPQAKGTSILLIND